MADNKFLEFNENKADLLTDAEYQADTQRLQGLSTGMARTILHNKLFRQLSVMSSAIGQVIADNGINANDSNRATLVQAIKDAFFKAKNSKLETATADLFGLNGVDANVDKALGSLKIPKVIAVKLDSLFATDGGLTGTSVYIATYVPWESVIVDTVGGGAFSFDNSTRLVIPQGVSKIRLLGNIKFGDNITTANTDGALKIYKNDVELNIQPDYPAYSRASTTNVFIPLIINSPPLDVLPGDHFEILCAGTRSVTGGYKVGVAKGSYFGFEVL